MIKALSFLAKYKINMIKIIKIAIGSSIAILIAEFFGLAYSASAGIITLLSVQDTKRETLKIAGKRFLAFLYAVIIAYVLFRVLGYYTHVFGVFLLVFITGSYLFHIQDGIAMCSVLVSHFLIEKNMEAAFIGNEVGILVIGLFVGILVNLYMPGKTDLIKTDMESVEEKIKVILVKLADCMVIDRGKTGMDTTLNCNGVCCLVDEFTTLEEHLSRAVTISYENMNNTLLSDTRYYIQYFTMRRNQLIVLKHIQEQVCLLTIVPSQSVPISSFIHSIANQFHEYNNAEKLLKELAIIKEKYKEEPNPKTREEFENRAILYLILYDLENFLIIKRNFVRSISEKQIKTFWN